MVRSKRARKPVKQKVDNKEEVYDEPDPEGDDFFHDDVDKFHAEREKILLDSSAYSKDGQEESSDDDQQDEVVMALNVDESGEESEDGEDDEEGEEEENDLNINEHGHGEDQDNEIDEEDDEEESENEEDVEKGIPSQKSWGRKKAAFYDADIMEEYAGSDEEMDKLAEEEEEEALALQKHMAASLEEQDFDVANFEFQLPDIVPKKDKYKTLDTKIVQDLSKLSRAEKIQILIKDSPELLKLLDEFKFKLKEVMEKLYPLVKMARAGQVPKEGADYLELKHQLYLNYCVNIGFYLYLKARQTPVRDHPVIERLVQYKKLITELEPLDEKLKPEVEVLLSQGQISRENGLQEKLNPNGHDNKKRSKKLSQHTGKLSSLLDDDDSDTDDSQDKTEDGGTAKTKKEGKVKKPKKDKKRKRKVEGEADAMDPLEYYEAVKLLKKKKQKAKEAALSFTTQGVVDEEETGDGKRGITYEISQNKGLTAKKKKELRNPRVKHRRKFYKAQIKRKSQVLPVVNEQNRYDGEMTGIRSHLTRSVKIK